VPTSSDMWGKCEVNIGKDHGFTSWFHILVSHFSASVLGVL
jgi:hypothetical protein